MATTTGWYNKNGIYKHVIFDRSLSQLLQCRSCCKQLQTCRSRRLRTRLQLRSLKSLKIDFVAHQLGGVFVAALFLALGVVILQLHYAQFQTANDLDGAFADAAKAHSVKDIWNQRQQFESIRDGALTPTEIS